MKCNIGVSVVPNRIGVVQIMSQSQQHSTTCKTNRVMRLLCRNSVFDPGISTESDDRTELLLDAVEDIVKG